jgi:GTP-binding protein EngB required for normal cell division
MELAIVAALALAVIILVVLLKRRTSGALPEIVIYGPSNSGKTRLFYMVT